MRKLAILTTLIMLTSFFAGCKKNENTTVQTPTKPSDFRNTVGIAKIIAHPALDDFERGVIDGLKNLGYTNLKLDMQNANGEISTATSIANKFKSEKVSVAVAIATPMAQTLVNNLKDIPVVFGAVTDPVNAGLRSDVVSEEKPVTGVCDMSPVQSQIVLATMLKNIKKLGFIYNSGEANSIALLQIVEDVCKELGIELVKTTVTNTSEVKQATEFISPRCDAIYVATDNVVYAALTSVAHTAKKYKIPVIAAVPDSDPRTGTLASYGIDYYESGKMAASMVADILSGKPAGQIPVLYPAGEEGMALYINEDVAASLDIKIPEELLKQSKPMKKYDDKSL